MTKRRPLVLAAALLALQTATLPTSARTLVMGQVTAPTGLDPHVAVGLADATVAMRR